MDPEQIPDEALPIAGVLECLGAENEQVVLDGASRGPHHFRLPQRDARASHVEDCLLSKVQFLLTPPEGFTYRAREPSALAERCQELGGCELQRLVACPATVGYLKPIAARAT